MKFDIVVGNPPYKGEGDPLYLRIIKTIYKNSLNVNGIISMIHPTSIVENKFEGSSNYENLKKTYGDLKVNNFFYSKKMRDIFSGVEIVTGIGIFQYSKNGSHTLFDDELKITRFGYDYLKDIEIIKITDTKPMVGNGDSIRFVHSFYESERKKVIDSTDYRYYVLLQYHRGNTDKKTGVHKWSWATLMDEDKLKVFTAIPYDKRLSVICSDDFRYCVEMIKWLNTDFVMFIVNHFKSNLANGKNLYTHIPQPPLSGDFSDNSLCDYFNLSGEQMEYIHNKVKEFGHKVHLKCTEQELMKRIEDINGKPSYEVEADEDE